MPVYDKQSETQSVYYEFDKASTPSLPEPIEPIEPRLLGLSLNMMTYVSLRPLT